MASLIVVRKARFAAWILLAAVLIVYLQWSGQSSASSAATSAPRVPVLVELFTSEGCSDCPPADALLGKVDADQPFAGVQVIVLSEHVTYWNHDGWRDPFSLDAMTERQQEYVRRFGLESSYTPQLVVDGKTQFVGSDARALTAAASDAAKSPKQPLIIENAHWDHDAASFSIRGGVPDGAQLIAVLAANATHQEVSGGENAGRTLHHVAVVRVMKELGRDAVDSRSVKLSGGDLNDKSDTGPIRLVVFLVDRKSGHVLGATEQPLTR
jgi:hypothetical protein